MDYMIIDGKSIPYPNDFQLKKTLNVAAEITTMDGNTYADVIGWKYENTTLQWDTLLEEDLQNLLDATRKNGFDITFNDISGEEITLSARMVSRVETKTRRKFNGKTIWKDVQVELMFPRTYR